MPIFYYIKKTYNFYAIRQIFYVILFFRYRLKWNIFRLYEFESCQNRKIAVLHLRILTPIYRLSNTKKARWNRTFSGEYLFCRHNMVRMTKSRFSGYFWECVGQFQSFSSLKIGIFKLVFANNLWTFTINYNSLTVVNWA